MTASPDRPTGNRPQGRASGNRRLVGFVALVLNLVVAAVLSPLLRGRLPEGTDATAPADYHADEGSEDLKPVAEPIGEGSAAR